MPSDVTDPGEFGWRPPGWAAPVTLVICAFGIAVASYLTYAHYTDASNLACSDSGTINCAKVTTSAQSRFLGMPVAVLGLAYFVAMTAACLPFAWRRPERVVRIGRVVAAAGGIAMVLWLVYAELFIINAICLWCTVVHGLSLLLFVAIASATVVGSSGPGPAEDFEDYDDDPDYDDETDADAQAGKVAGG